ncbi:hypothetical protein Gbfr_027_027 [Gluconobacter frateurii M-2]|nr:hypothetical protein Gbfr_027_027 [Gluconobacter frateurii M-2]
MSASCQWITFPSFDGSEQRRPVGARDFDALVEGWYQKPYRPRCDCLHDDLTRKLELQIRRSSSGQGDRARYTLAAMPYQARLHSPSCKFWSDRSGGRHSKQERLDAIQKIVDPDTGRILIDISIDAPIKILCRASSAEKDVPMAIRRKHVGKQRNSLTLLGLLLKIWKTADFHRWFPAQANARWSRVTTLRLKEAMQDCICNGQPLAAIGLVLRSKVGLEAAQAQALAEACSEAQSRALLVGVLTAAPEQLKGEDEFSLPLEGAHEITLYPMISQDRLGKWEDRFPTEAAMLKQKQGLVFFIGTASLRRWRPNGEEGPDRCYANVEQFALMATNGDGRLIPVDSNYELQVADALIAGRRCFEKPLALEALPPGTIGLPDFLLWGKGKARVMEVFGRGSEDRLYQVRKRHKIENNDRVFGKDGWWQWDITVQPTMPALPPSG